VSKCTNEETGRLLHGYEIGILSEREREQFEAHLLGCEHCHSMLEAFEQKASLLMTSEKARAVISEMGPETAEAMSHIGRLRKYLWPKVPLIFRPAVAYLAILILLVPAYLGLKKPRVVTVTELRQTIHLSPTRSSADILSRSTSTNGLLTFEFDGYRSDRTYGVTIRSESGDIVYRKSDFTSFDHRQIGNLNLRLSEIKPGRYRLVISDTSSDRPAVIQEYLFIIE
jgi:hypothetical protein